MALSPDQKKHLLIGGGVGAILVGLAIFGGHKAVAGPVLPGGHGGHGHGERGRNPRQDGVGDGENGRGEYGGGKKKHHHGGHHGH